MSRRPVIAVIVVILLGVGVGAATLASGDDLQSKGTTLRTDRGTEGTPTPAVEAAVGALEKKARSEGAIAFGLDASGQYVALFPRGGDIPELSSPSLAVRSLEAKWTKEEYARLDAAILSTLDPKTTTSAFYVDAASGKVVLDTDAPAAAIELLVREFPGMIDYRAGGTAAETSRNADASPHYGGSAISNGVKNCTAGPIINQAGGPRVAVTAGHCFPVSSTITSGAFSYGIVVNTAYPTWDQAIITTTTSFSFRVYHGNATTTAVLNQTGAGNPSNGLSYCVSGRNGSTCGHVVYSTGATVTLDGHTYTGIILATGAVPAGDSGGTFHTVSGSSAGVRGMAIGASAGSGWVAIEPWSRIASRWNATIATN